MLRAEVGSLLRRLYRRAGGDQPDAALLERFAHGRDEGAFAALVERHGPLVFGVCRRVLRHQQDAEDAFQATFLILARRAACVARGEALAPWLHTVAYRLARRARADAARRPAAEPRDLAMLRAEPDSAAGRRDLRPLLDAELQRLPAKYRAAVVLCYLEGHTHAEAARQLGWPIGTVAGRLARARALLRDRLERRGVTLSAGLLATVLAEQAGAGPVPTALTRLTIQNAATFAAGSTVAGVSAKVAALAEGGLQAMFAAKVKMGVLVLTLLLVASGAGLWAQQVLSEQPAPEQPPAEARRAKPDEQEPQARVDFHGDPLPDGAVARLGTVRWRRYSGGGKLLFSPDGKLLAAAELTGREAGICLWDVSTGKPVRRFTGGRFTPLGFSPDGKRLFSIEWKGIVRIWDVATGKESSHYQLGLTGLEGYGKDGYLLSPDAKLLASFGQREIRLHEAETGKELRTLEGAKREWTSVSAFSPDGKIVAGRLHGEAAKQEEGPALWLWDVSTGKKVRGIGRHKLAEPFSPGRDLFPPIAYSWDSRLVGARGPDGTVTIWDVATGHERHRFADPTAAEEAPFVFTRDNKQLLSRTRGGGLVWDLATGQQLRTFGKHPWSNFALSPDGRFVATAGAQALCLWEVATGKQVAAFAGHTHEVHAAAFLKDNRTVVSAGHRELCFWDGLTGQSLAAREVEERCVVRFSADGQFLTYSRADPAANNEISISLCEVATGKELHRLKSSLGPPAFSHRIAFSPDSRLLAAAWGSPFARGNSPQSLGVWQVSTGKELHMRTVEVPNGQLAFSPDGQTLAFRGLGAGDPEITQLWDVQAGQPLYPLSAVGRQSVGTDLAFSPDGKLLATAASDSTDTDWTVILWEVASGRERGVLTGLKADVYALAFSPDGRMLAIASYADIRIWEVATLQERARMQGHASPVPCLAYSRDGRYLVSGSMDTTLLVWDVASVLRRTEAPRARPSAKEVEAAWATLAGADAAAAHTAIHLLASAPEHSLPLLRQRLRPAPVVPPEMLKQWVRALDDARFAQRDLAGRQLEAAGAAAEPLLKQALAGQPSAELRQRVEQLLQKLRGPVTHPETLRSIRAVEVLERVGTADARALLKTLAAGAPEARQTREAKAALQRLTATP